MMKPMSDIPNPSIAYSDAKQPNILPKSFVRHARPVAMAMSGFMESG